MTQQTKYMVERIDNPAAFYEQHVAALDTIGADAFGQPVEEFAPQVEERFKKAAFGHAMYDLGQLGDEAKLVGFGLFDIVRGRHWRPQLAFHRG